MKTITLTERKLQKLSETHYSWCECGHIGDGVVSEHEDTITQPGHGGCKICSCPQFRWVKFIKKK